MEEPTNGSDPVLVPADPALCARRGRRADGLSLQANMTTRNNHSEVSDTTACVIAAARCAWAALEHVKALTDGERSEVARRLSAKAEWDALTLLHAIERRIKVLEQTSSMG